MLARPAGRAERPDDAGLRRPAPPPPRETASNRKIPRLPPESSTERPFAAPLHWMHGPFARPRHVRARANSLARAWRGLVESGSDKRTELLRSASQAAHHWETAKRRRKAPVSRKSDLPPAPRRAPGSFSSQALGRASSGTTTGGAPLLLPQGRNRNVNGAKEPQVVHDVYKIIRQLWLAVIAPGAVTLALLVRYEDWDAAYAHTSFDVFFWITVGILVLIGVAGNVLMFRSRGPMLLLENLGVLGVLTILVSVATLVATFLFVVFAIASIFKKDSRR